MVEIPAGYFWMGVPEDVTIETSCEDQPNALEQVYLDAFYIDLYEVTVEEFQACVTAGGCSEDFIDTVDDYEGCNYGDASKLQHPMNCVDWWGMSQYCDWKGKRLPLESEWEKAARGWGGQVYPWGNAPPSCDLAVYSDPSPGCGTEATWPVGSKSAGASPFGLEDMAGNVAEWTSRCTVEMDVCVYKGGSYGSGEHDLATYHRDCTSPSSQPTMVGGRCVL